MTADDIEALIRTGIGNQHAAAEPRISAWVSASAGAGKTHVLANRVLRLMLAGARPNGILCLTYTKVAASEMANRIFAHLGRWAAADNATLAASLVKLIGTAPDDATMARARRLFAEVLDLPGGLRIQTIHAFCQSLLARFPIEAGIGANSRIVDERTTEEILASARDRTLQSALAGGDATPLARAIACLSERAGEFAVRKVIGQLFERRGRLRRAVMASITAEGAASALTERLVAMTPVGDADVAALRAAVAALASGTKTDRDRGSGIAAWLAAGAPDHGPSYEQYASLFITDEGGIRKTLAYKAVADANPAVVETLTREAERVRMLMQRRHAEATAEVSGALVRLGHAMLDVYDQQKRQQGVLDYDDLIDYSRGLLGTRDIGWVHYKLDGGIDHILIDEAQDTSPEQWQIVEGLTGDFFAGAGWRDEDLGDAPARTVFAVGDVKQSIFSFQGAEPAEFPIRGKGFATRVGSAKREWKGVTLNLSFRSAPEILALVDRVFGVPGAADGVALDRASIAHAATRHNQAGRVELWPIEVAAGKAEPEPWAFPLAVSGNEAPSIVLARRIAAKIKQWIGNETLPARGRTVRAGDVLILVRRRDDFFHAMVQALKALDVPVAGSDRMVLTDEIAVRDLMAAGAFALLPEDDLNLASLLKSPLIDFSEDDLFRLAAERQRPVLWHELEARRADCALFASTHARLHHWLARADFVPPFEFFSSLLNEEGGRERLVARLGPEVHDPIDEFLSLALAYEGMHPPSLQGFRAWAERSHAEIKRDQGDVRDEVRVMTVHGAKGLEAPIVILPDTCTLPRNHESVLWIGDGGVDGELPLWPAPGKPIAAAVDAVKTRVRDADLREYRRLLYVALTRAEDRLYVCGWGNKNANGSSPTWYQMVEAAFDGWSAVESISDGTASIRRVDGGSRAEPDKPGDDAVAAAAFGAIKIPLALAGPPPREGAGAVPLAPSRIDADELAPASPRAGLGTAAGLRGRLIHRLLQWLPALPEADREKAAARYLGRPLFALDAKDRRNLQEAVLAVLRTPGFLPLFGLDSRAEVPITGRAGADDAFVVSGQVDRLVILPNAVQIVDFKTNRAPPKSAGAVPTGYLRQMAAYRAVLSKALPGRAISCALLWTEGPELMPLPGDLLDRYAP